MAIQILDYVFILRENYVSNRNIRNNIGMFPTFEMFLQVMGSINEDSLSLLLIIIAKINKLIDQVSLV